MKFAPLIPAALGLLALSGCSAQVQNALKVQADLTQAQQAAQNGDAAGAKSWADQAVAVDPGALDTFLPTRDPQVGDLTVAGVFAASGDAATLRDYMKQAAQKHPDDYRPLQQLAQVYGTLGDTADRRAAAAAEAALLEKKIVAPHDATATEELSLSLAQAYCDAGSLAKGAADFQAVIRAHPADPEAYNSLAYAYAVSSSSTPADLKSANALARQALALAAKQNVPEEDVAAFQDTLGWVQYRRGGPQDLKDALANLQAAVSVLPRLAESRYHLGMVYAALGRPDAARAELGHAVLLTSGYADAQRALSGLNEAHPARTAAGP